MQNSENCHTHGWGKNSDRKLPTRFLVGLVCLTLASPVLAGSREQAKRIHDRLTGAPPTEAVLDRMVAEIATDPVAAAMIAIDGPNNPNAKHFYNVTLKNFATPWTNRDQSVFEPLNDYTAMVIGMIRDDVPFNQLLSADFMYVGNGPVSDTSNQHFEDLEANGVDLIVVGSHHPSAQDSFLGSTAARVARRAPCSVMILR